MSSDWNLIPENCGEGPSHPAGTLQTQWELPPQGAGDQSLPPTGPAPDLLSACLPSSSQKPSALLFQLLRAGLPAIVLGSLSVILGPLRKDQTARKTLGS